MRMDRGMAFKGKSNRSGDIKKWRGSLEGKSGWKCKRGRGIEMVIAREGDV